LKASWKNITQCKKTTHEKGGRMILADTLFKAYPDNALKRTHYRTRKTTIILISGKAGAGKSLAATHMVEPLKDYYGIMSICKSFATSIKNCAYEFFMWDGEKNEKGRALLQNLGDVGRAYDKDLYPRLLEESLWTFSQIPNFIFVDDWRFPNESEYFKSKMEFEVVTVRIFGRDALKGSLNGSHTSEISLPEAQTESLVYNKDDIYNFSVENTGTILQFRNKLDGILDYLTTKLIKY
jgi:energy-coupling factor transporter ATP-binding protein EcfA2